MLESAIRKYRNDLMKATPGMLDCTTEESNGNIIFRATFDSAAEAKDFLATWYGGENLELDKMIHQWEQPEAMNEWPTWVLAAIDAGFCGTFIDDGKIEISFLNGAIKDFERLSQREEVAV